ncbi:putative Glutaredoxin domain-containing protein [Seiridium unicorne]|uniref:Glutaredoxin domain-containing protein n=1 Tax=Seiridium unicorne TaxID=138068 RepID=A0ABR2V3Y2_9PEZI
MAEQDQHCILLRVSSHNVEFDMAGHGRLLRASGFWTQSSRRAAIRSAASPDADSPDKPHQSFPTRSRALGARIGPIEFSVGRRQHSQEHTHASSGFRQRDRLSLSSYSVTTAHHRLSYSRGCAKSICDLEAIKDEQDRPAAISLLGRSSLAPFFSLVDISCNLPSVAPSNFKRDCSRGTELHYSRIPHPLYPTPHPTINARRSLAAPQPHKMPSARRLRALFLVALAVVITILFFTSQWQQTSERDTRSIQDFYHKTMNAMDGKRGSGGSQVVMSGKGGKVSAGAKDKDGDGSVDKDDEKLAEEMSDRLRAAEQKAKDLANAKAPLKPDSPGQVVGVGSSAGGQGKKDVAAPEDETDEEHEIEVTLNEILKRSPTIIFSKSYCPYSKKAKKLLLEKYSIEPPPFVVELDEHPLGKQLQDKLGEMTGRRTVPNIMINGKSIGGSDDIAELDSRGTLIDKVKSMGGKRVSMKEKFVGSSNKKA